MPNHAATIAGDRALIQIVDAALAEAARKSGSWLVCRPGCTQCCIGPFAINTLDAERLRRGLGELHSRDPHRAQSLRDRARASVARISADFPGDPDTGWLDDSDEAELRFETFANDEPCPALDPISGTCDLYEWRPMTCRLFGPPLRVGEQAVGICELCFEGATDDQIAACEVDVHSGLELDLLQELGDRQTIVAFCLTH
jgi:Fe-S-cluster containining protein